MASVGLLYLLSEKSILSASSAAQGQLSSPMADGLSRNILGAQIGLVVLAMVITRSSVSSLQAKRGLPLGNQVIGWLILSKPIPEKPELGLQTILIYSKLRLSLYLFSTASNQTAIISIAWSSCS